MENYNLKIPLALIQNYHLSPLAMLIYAEIYGICKKNGVCYITTKTLIKRHNSTNRTIKRAISELKQAKLIKRKSSTDKTIRKLVLLSIDETPETKNKFCLVPSYILQNSAINRRAEIIYGYLVSERKKQEKINADKHREDARPLITVSKSKLARALKSSTQTIRRSLQDLKASCYLDYESIYGKSLQIDVFNYNEIFRVKLSTGQRLLTAVTLDATYNLLQKWHPTYYKNGTQPTTKMAPNLLQKWHTNRVLINNINKEKELSSSSSNKDHLRGKLNPNPQTPEKENELVNKPFYYDDLPSEKDIPPYYKKETDKDINELNILSRQQSTSKCNKDQKHDSTANGGLGVAKDKPLFINETCPTSNQTNAKYEKYNGFNLSYQCNELQKILREKTGKRYILTTQQPLIEQRLKDGFTLNDFEMAIVYLLNQGQSISIKDLLINISNYKSKINSN